MAEHEMTILNVVVPASLNETQRAKIEEKIKKVLKGEAVAADDPGVADTSCVNVSVGVVGGQHCHDW